MQDATPRSRCLPRFGHDLAVPGKGNGAAKDERRQAKTQPKDESQPVTSLEKTESPHPQNGSESPLLAKVRVRLEESKISEPEFLDILRTAQISEAIGASSFADIPDKPLSLALESWDTVVELTAEFRKCKESAA